MPSTKAREIAARVWCDQEMKDVTMDAEAAELIAYVIDGVLKENAKEKKKDWDPRTKAKYRHLNPY